MRRRGRCSALLRLSIVCSLVACESAVAVVHKQPGKPVDGRAVCNGSSWTGASAEQLLSGQVEPHVQCAREPPCVRWSWVRMELAQTRVATLLVLRQPQRVAARRSVTSHVASRAQTSFARCALLPLDADWPTCARCAVLRTSCVSLTRLRCQLLSGGTRTCPRTRARSAA